jgi:hypothetical protein
MLNEKVQYMHFRTVNRQCNGGATVAILPADNNKVLFTVARCGPHDLFNKKIGRTIATGRLKAYLDGRETVSNHVRTMVINDPLYIKEAVGGYLYEEMAKYDLY